jgi:hypothetical protein
MKNTTLFLALFLFLPLFFFSQSPSAIPYQAIVRNTDCSVMANTALTLSFMIHDASALGTLVCEESQATSSNSQGLINVNVGSGNAPYRPQQQCRIHCVSRWLPFYQRNI